MTVIRAAVTAATAVAYGTASFLVDGAAVALLAPVVVFVMVLDVVPPQVDRVRRRVR